MNEQIEPFSAMDEASMLELLHVSNYSADGHVINEFSLGNGNPVTVNRLFKDLVKTIANNLLPHEVYGDKGLNQPDFGSLNLDIKANDEGVEVMLNKRPVKLGLVDQQGNIVLNDSLVIYQEVFNEALYRWNNGPCNSRRTA
ncbi:hypothetical protein GCM10023116_39080 [Kistimonas scapharcae]|uniref:Uncharacterized protein n=1 Tax=Kistimonas scapharcae TaxID=1036133 RepID=A0ABP8V6L6_9GAMM